MIASMYVESSTAIFSAVPLTRHWDFNNVHSINYL